MRTTLLAILLGFLATGCDPAKPVVGSDEVFVLPNSQIVITSSQLTNNKLVANGTVKNVGSTTYSPYWYVEGEFYADSTFVLKLGGTNQTFTFSLGPGEQTVWQLQFTSSVIDVNQYPKFRVKNIRAIRDQN